MDIQDCPKFGYIPKQLVVPGVPKLSNFPFNIMFELPQNNKYFAVYTAQINTYQEEADLQIMTYFNEGDPRVRVVILFNTKYHCWHGEKFFEGEQIGEADGSDWNMFFVHLTMLGCSRQERVTCLDDGMACRLHS